MRRRGADERASKTLSIDISVPASVLPASVLPAFFALTHRLCPVPTASSERTIDYLIIELYTTGLWMATVWIFHRGFLWEQSHMESSAVAMSAAARNIRYDLGVDLDAVDEALQRSESTFRSPRMVDADDTDAVEGVVRWKAGKSLWISSMTIAGLAGGPFFFSWS